MSPCGASVDDNLGEACSAVPPRPYMGGPCTGDHRDGHHHNAAGFFWGPVEASARQKETR